MRRRRPIVLVVDDDELALAALRAILHLETDYIVRLETDPRLALEMIAKTDVDVVISDFVMPQMDGLRFLEEVHRLRPAASLILLSGHADQTRVRKAIRDLGIHYMEKPWSNDALLRHLRSAAVPTAV